MQGVAPLPDPAVEDRVDEVVAAVREEQARLRPVTVALGAAVVGTGGVWVPAGGHEDLVALREAVRRGVQRVLPPPGEPDEPYWPHLSLTYATGAGRLEPARAEALTRLAGLEWSLEAATLVRLHCEPGLYSWSVIADAPLGRADANTSGP